MEEELGLRTVQPATDHLGQTESASAFTGVDQHAATRNTAEGMQPENRCKAWKSGEYPDVGMNTRSTHPFHS